MGAFVITAMDAPGGNAGAAAAPAPEELAGSDALQDKSSRRLPAQIDAITNASTTV